MIRLLCGMALLCSLPSAAAENAGPYAPIFPRYESPSEDEVDVFNARKFVSNVARSRHLTDADKVVASTCRRTIVLSEFLDQDELKRPLGPPEIKDLSAPVRSPLDAFKAIRSTSLGKAILKRFFPKYGTEIKLEMSAPSAIRAESQSSALAFYDPSRRLIRIEREAEVGTVAFVLLHEIIHALDRDYDSALKKQTQLREAFDEEVGRVAGETASRYRKPRGQLAQSDFLPAELTRLARLRLALDQMQDIQVFRAERYAYDASFDVWKELAERFPDYYKAKQGRELAGRINLKGEPIFYDDDHIVRINNLNPVYVRKYKEGKCLPWSGDLNHLPE